MTEQELKECREAFEEWFSDGGEWERSVERLRDGYMLSQAQSAWNAWQAAWNHRTAPEWQPIETAPKDGSEVVGYCPEMFGPCISTYLGDESGWFVDASSQDGMGFDNVNLTHWMPLPAEPKRGDT